MRAHTAGSIALGCGRTRRRNRHSSSSVTTRSSWRGSSQCTTNVSSRLNGLVTFSSKNRRLPKDGYMWYSVVMRCLDHSRTHVLGHGRARGAQRDSDDPPQALREQLALAAFPEDADALQVTLGGLPLLLLLCL